MLKQPSCPDSLACYLRQHPVLFQRTLHKICTNRTTACTVNLACFQSSWYVSSQALLQPAEKPLTLSLAGGPGRRLSPWLPGSWQVLVSFAGEMTAEKSVKPFSGSGLFGEQQRELAEAGRPPELARSGRLPLGGLACQRSTARTPRQGDACLK